jgi:hypothetical protein
MYSKIITMSYIIDLLWLYVDRADVLALHEAGRIDRFLKAMADAGKLSEFEWQVINQERDEAYRRAGYRDESDRPTHSTGDEFTGVVRHTSQLRRQKLVEFHPELTAELDRQLAEQKYHPLPPVPIHLMRPGAALQEYQALMGYIWEKRKTGQIKQDAAYDAYAPAIELFNQAGVDDTELDLQTDKALLAHAANLMRKMLVETHPELANEITKLGSGRSR